MYPESPRWHEDRLWFSDVHDYGLKTVTLAGEITTVAEVPARPAGLGFLPDETLLVATALDRSLSVLLPGALVPVSDLSGVASGLLNDMVVAREGRAYVGDTGFAPVPGAKERPGRIITRGPDGDIAIAAEDLRFPNGIAITSDGGTLYVAETRGQRITAFRVAPNGELVERRTLVDLGFPPDGICLDARGHLWVAGTIAEKFVEVRPDGQRGEEIRSPGRTAIACVFGDADRSRLILCSADTTMDRLSKGISHGRIDSADVRISGGGLP